MRLVPLLLLNLLACISDKSSPESDIWDGDLETTQGAIEITAVPGHLGVMTEYFSQYTAVFGVHIFATAGVPEEKTLHAAAVMAQYLDNDEDSEADDADVIAALVGDHGGSGLVMFRDEAEIESSGIFDADIPEMHLQDLYADETLPGGSEPHGPFDATLEEVLHLLQTGGISNVYPTLAMETGSAIAEAMDTARGGHFTSIPSEYPEEAWYHYDDSTCEYDCMMAEYFYWGLTTWLGAQNYPGRCEEISQEWEVCTAAEFEATDTALHALLTDPQYNLATVLPDGRYRSD